MSDTPQGAPDGLAEQLAQSVAREQSLRAYLFESRNECKALRDQLEISARSIEEWQRLRREVATAEQGYASQTHELLREKAKNQALEVAIRNLQAPRRPWWRRLTFGAWCVVIAYFALVACIIGGMWWFWIRP